MTLKSLGHVKNGNKMECTKHQSRSYSTFRKI